MDWCVASQIDSTYITSNKKWNRFHVHYMVSICNRSLNLSIMWTTYLNRNGYPSEDEDIFIWFALWDLSCQTGRTRFNWMFLPGGWWWDWGWDSSLIYNMQLQSKLQQTVYNLEQLILLMRMGSFSSYHHHHHHHQWHWYTNKEDMDVFIYMSRHFHSFKYL